MIPIEKLTEFTGKASVPMGFVAVIVYLFMWGARIQDRVELQANQLSQIERMEKSHNRLVRRIDRRFFMIEEKLHVEHPDEDPEDDETQ